MTREESSQPYPYNERTNTVKLPPDIEKELRQLVAAGNKIEAMKHVLQLTGAGLKVSKDYVDQLEGRSKRR